MNRYFSKLTSRVGGRWNRFWFTPSDPLPVCAMRVLVGLAALYFVFSYSFELVRWFGPDGILPTEVVQRMAQSEDASRTGLESPVAYVSYLNLATTPAMLWAMHVAGLTVLLMFTAGAFTRITSILSLIVVLSYVARAPMLTGPFETVLTMMMFNLCFAPAGVYLSVDRWLRGKRSSQQTQLQPPGDDKPTKSTAANVVMRLTQVHLAMLYAVMGLSKLLGVTWQDGGAVWWLITRTESRLIDLTFLHAVPNAVYLWTHLIVIFELAFAVLIWNRLARPLLLIVSVVMWTSLALVTGLISFCAIMLIANLAFVPPQQLRRLSNAMFSRLRRLSKTRKSDASATNSATAY